MHSASLTRNPSKQRGTTSRHSTQVRQTAHCLPATRLEISFCQKTCTSSSSSRSESSTTSAAKVGRRARASSTGWARCRCQPAADMRTQLQLQQFCLVGKCTPQLDFQAKPPSQASSHLRVPRSRAPSAGTARHSWPDPSPPPEPPRLRRPAGCTGCLPAAAEGQAHQERAGQQAVKHMSWQAQIRWLTCQPPAIPLAQSAHHQGPPYLSATPVQNLEGLTCLAAPPCQPAHSTARPSSPPAPHLPPCTHLGVHALQVLRHQVCQRPVQDGQHVQHRQDHALGGEQYVNIVVQLRADCRQGCAARAWRLQLRVPLRHEAHQLRRAGRQVGAHSVGC